MPVNPQFYNQNLMQFGNNQNSSYFMQNYYGNPPLLNNMNNINYNNLNNMSQRSNLNNEFENVRNLSDNINIHAKEYIPKHKVKKYNIIS